MPEAQVIGFALNNKLATLKLFKENPEKYNVLVVFVKLSEAGKGYICTKANKPNKKGTMFRFKTGTKDEFEKYYDGLKKECEEIGE